MMLHIAENLDIPLEAVTETFAILGKRGTGKTATAVVLAEEMLKAGQQVVIFDPVGVWWGLRSSRDGESPGLPIVILGGEHADAPLIDNAGEAIADLVVDERLPVVLDVADFSQGEQARFITDFAERLYRRKASQRQPLHLILDEADAFVPQQPMPDERRMLGAMDRIVRRGRVRGLGVTLISQRPAVVNKNVLTQTEVLIPMQLTGPPDLKAIDAWISAQGTSEQRKALLESLPSLPRGRAWICSPRWLEMIRQVAIRQRETFDSSATPKVGEQIEAPRRWAEVDMAALRERLSAPAISADETDVTRLRARIQELERQLQNRPLEVQIKTIKIPVFRDGEVEQLARVAGDIDGVAKDLQQMAIGIRAALDLAANGQPAPVEEMPAEIEAPEVVPSLPETPAEIPAPTRAAAGVRQETGQESAFGASRSVAGSRSVASRREAVPEIGVSGPQQKLLDSLAVMAALGLTMPTRDQLAFFRGVRANTGSFNGDLTQLKNAGLISYPQAGFLALTAQGRQQAAPPAAIPTLRSLHEQWLRKLSNPQADTLRILIDAYPGSMSRAAIAKSRRVQANTGSFNGDLTALRNLGLVEYPSSGYVAASRLLFPKGLK